MKKVEVIQNRFENEDPVQDFELPALSGGADMDFIQSDDLAQIEEGIRAIDQTTGMLKIVQGLAILKAESLWEQSGVSSLHGYRKVANTRYGMSRASISNLRKMAYAWLDNVRMLRGLDLSGKASHLLYLDDAIKQHGNKRIVLDHFKSLSARDFAAWARGPVESREALPDVDVSIRAGVVALDGRPLMALNDDLPDDERDFLARTIKAAYRARRGDCIAHVIAVYDDGEARAVDNFLKKLRASR